MTDVPVGEQFTCAIRAGALYCWGYNADGLGNGATDSAVPVLVAASGASQVSVSGNHACYLSSAGGVKCWGNNATGEVATGYRHTCAGLKEGAARCWGYAQAGQLGIGTDIGGDESKRYLTPQLVLVP